MGFLERTWAGLRNGWGCYVNGDGRDCPDLMATFSPQAVEELLESLDLEKSSCCMGLSRVSCPHVGNRVFAPWWP